MDKDNNLAAVGKYVGLAFLLPISILVGLAIGYGLDKLFKTHFLVYVFLVFGIASGFIELIRELTRETSGK